MPASHPLKTVGVKPKLGFQDYIPVTPPTQYYLTASQNWQNVKDMPTPSQMRFPRVCFVTIEFNQHQSAYAHILAAPGGFSMLISKAQWLKTPLWYLLSAKHTTLLKEEKKPQNHIAKAAASRISLHLCNNTPPSDAFLELLSSTTTQILIFSHPLPPELL